MRRERGHTILELLAALFVLLVAGAVAWRIAPPDLGLEARALAQAIARVRALGASTGAGVLVLAGRCGSSSRSVLPAKLIAHVVEAPRGGLLFTPDGLPRTCDGGGVGNTTILLEHRGRQAAVIVSSLGRVRWELR